MTASVSGFSVLQGFSSALDTMLPSAWTSPHPHYVGLWTQRMSELPVVLYFRSGRIEYLNSRGYVCILNCTSASMNPGRF